VPAGNAIPEGRASPLAGGKGWAVLRAGDAELTGAPGSGVRMRDWDTRGGSSDEGAAPDDLGAAAGAAADSDGDSGDDSGDGGW